MMRAVAVVAFALGVLGTSGCCEPGKWWWECRSGGIPDVTECVNAPEGSPVTCAADDPEPNDTMPMAHDMTPAACDPVPVSGTLAGSGDADYFKSHGELCADGVATLETDMDGVEVCLFVQCSVASTSIVSCSTPQGLDGGLVRHHPSGLLGCCRSTRGKVDFTVSCNGTDKNVDVYLLAAHGPAACTPYSAHYHL